MVIELEYTLVLSVRLCFIEEVWVKVLPLFKMTSLISIAYIFVILSLAFSYI